MDNLINLSIDQKNFIHIIGVYIVSFALIIFATRFISPKKNIIWTVIGVLLLAQFIFFILSLVFLKNTRLEKIFWLLFNFFTFITVASLLYSMYFESVEFYTGVQKGKSLGVLGYFFIILAILGFIGLKQLFKRLRFN